MRIISGSLRGRKLQTLPGNDTRPTTDNVKESIFNIVQFSIAGCCVLDLFAGSGQLGIECLSRGASKAVFVDKNRAAVDVIRKNLQICGLKSDVIQTDALSYLKHSGKFDIVFLDPPYDSSLYDPILKNINLFDILNEGGIIIVESRKEEVFSELFPPYYFMRDYIYGKIKVSLFTRHSEGESGLS